ncbi:MAG: NifU family protein [Candidatus Uhrbacteria bacterium]|nr:NifU family protein [Candidatus Uhrbacteria bacterium]
MREAIETVLAEVRKSLRLHAGGIDLVDVDESAGRVTVRLTGTCSGCSLASITLKQGVEVAICERVPGVKEIIAV